MRYWWVNQSQTYRHEVPGGYLWSPKRKSNGQANPFYEFMREVSPGDAIFSFCDAAINAIGIAQSNAYEAPKPLEFGNVGAYWELIGWRVDVQFTELESPVRPIDHMSRLQPYLPTRYAPLRANGWGQQNIYLTELNDLLSYQLIDLIGREARSIINAWRVERPLESTTGNGQVVWEEHQIDEVKANTLLAETEKESIVMARRGQGLFRSRVVNIERCCRITGVNQLEYLRASHTKPWRDASNEERLDGENGFLLTPDVDLLFDRGFISFDNNGDVLVSPVADITAFQKMGLNDEMLRNAGSFSVGQRQYLQFHRDNVFLRSKFNSG